MASGDSKNDDERARRAAAELKETEDLLAGFDRPGRTPRTPPVKRDFVDYHLEKGRSNPSARLGSAPADRSRRDLPTAVIPGHKRLLPPWLPWAGLLAVMSLGGVLVAAAVSGPSESGQSTTPSSSLASAATTLASGTPNLDPTTGPARDIPPPPPSTNESAPDSEGASQGSVLTTSGTTITGAPTEPTEPTGASAALSASTGSTARRSAASAGSTATANAPATTTNPTPSPAPSAPPTTSASAAVDLIRNL